MCIRQNISEKRPKLCEAIKKEIRSSLDECSIGTTVKPSKFLEIFKF